MRIHKILREAAGSLRREWRLSTVRPDSVERWAFIVGCYNSGTTLLHAMLEPHPDVNSLPDEGQHFTDQFVKDYEVGLPRLWTIREKQFRMTESYVGKVDGNRLQREWLLRMQHREKRVVALEKTISNSARTRWLNSTFPNAHFICIVRNPLAVAEGIRRKVMGGHAILIEAAARQWLRTYEILKEDLAQVKRATWVSYEDLVAEPEQTIRGLLEFLSLDPQRMPVTEDFNVFGKQSKVTNENPASIARLTDEERARIESVAGAFAKELGY